MNRIHRWARNGPKSDDGLPATIVAHWLWWRTWVFMTLATVPLVVGAIGLEYYGGSGAIFGTYLGWIVVENKVDEYSINS